MAHRIPGFAAPSAAVTAPPRHIPLLLERISDAFTRMARLNRRDIGEVDTAFRKMTLESQWCGYGFVSGKEDEASNLYLFSNTDNGETLSVEKTEEGGYALLDETGGTLWRGDTLVSLFDYFEREVCRPLNR